MANENALIDANRNASLLGSNAAGTESRRLQVNDTGGLTVETGEQNNSFSRLNAAATTTLKTGSGVLHRVIITTAGATGNRITLYDNTSGTGVVIADFNPPTTGSLEFNCKFSTGLTVVVAGTTPPDVTVVYR